MRANFLAVAVADDHPADHSGAREPGANDKCAELDPDDPWPDADTHHQHTDRRAYNRRAHREHNNFPKRTAPFIPV